MNFRTDNRNSVFLMSSRLNAPYTDQWLPEKQVLIYEGHDASVDTTTKDKKRVDQPMHRPSGKLTENGKFYNEAIAYREKRRTEALLVQVYEKLEPGIWFDKGIFELVDATYRTHLNRKVFKFYLHPKSEVPSAHIKPEYSHERMIPSHVKRAVWKRDGGQCCDCGAITGLHYDHILPFSKGGRSDDERNIQILCARHNLQKSNKIM